VFPVRYELGFHISEDDILHSHRHENFKSYRIHRDRYFLFAYSSPSHDDRFLGQSAYVQDESIAVGST
jgi:hypothetical protein